MITMTTSSRRARVPAWTLAALLALALGCKPAEPVAKPGEAATPAAAPAAETGATAEAAKTVVGAGATFPYPLYAKWGHVFHQQTAIKLNYQSIGSGGGIKQIKAKTVDFGASDAPLEKKELDESGLVQFPMIMGAVVPVARLPGVESNALQLDGPTLASMYLGEIKTWNDPRIAALNPGVTLPATTITPVYRADGSGTTWIFTNYLAKVSPAWKDKVGFDKSVSWPAGVGGKGNEGVAAYVQRVEGSLGYVEYAYAVQNKLTTLKMKNAAGQVVAPGIEAFQAAAANADWQNAPGYYVVLTEQPGEKSWPIVGASFILMHKEQPDARKAAALLQFFDFAFRKGADMATDLHYVPMPPAVVELVEKTWAGEIKAGGQPVWPRAGGAL